MKQIVVCLVAVLICFSIVGCEIINSFIDSIPTPTPSASSTPTPTPTPTEEEFRIIEIKEVDYLLLGRTEWNSYEYDEDGYMVKQNHFDYYGGLIGYTTYEYDERGNLTKESYYELGGWYWDTTRDTVYEYDPDGNLVRISTYTEFGELLSYQTNEYNNGIRITNSEYVAKEYVDPEPIYLYYHTEYDEEGRKIKESRYNEDGNLEHWQTYEYENGNVIYQPAYNGEGELDFYQLYEYDDNGFRIRWQTFYPNEEQIRDIRYTYDAEGNMTGFYSYDPNGDLIESYSTTYEVEYEYDEWGNTVKKTEYADDMIVLTVENKWEKGTAVPFPTGLWVTH